MMPWHHRVMLATPRLRLRPWRPDDLAPYAALCADPEVMEHFPSVWDRTRAEASMLAIDAHFEREGFGLWAVEVPGVAPFIGFTGLARPAFLPQSVEVGWRLARAYWGAGYATEAATAAVAWGFAHLPVDELISMTVAANVRSQRVMHKLGFTRDPARDFDHPNIPAGHPLRRHWMFRRPRPAVATGQ
jgi:ribosomal-protein-alanine N-acetyltransferase